VRVDDADALLLHRRVGLHGQVRLVEVAGVRGEDVRVRHHLLDALLPRLQEVLREGGLEAGDESGPRDAFLLHHQAGGNARRVSGLARDVVRLREVLRLHDTLTAGDVPERVLAYRFGRDGDRVLQRARGDRAHVGLAAAEVGG